MVSGGIREVDLHGLNTYQAKIFLDSQLKKCGRDVYRLRVIHGYHGGTELRTLVRGYKSHPKVLRVEIGLNQGATDLVLREF